MKQRLASALRRVDGALAPVYRALGGERPALLTFLFHGVFRDRGRTGVELVDPQQGTTVDDFRAFVDCFLASGYSFVSPDDVLRGLDATKRYVMATFDDGYFSNTHVVPVLEAYGIPAVFSVSTNHVRRGVCYWWDVLYRERIERGAAPATIFRERDALTSKKHDEIESILVREFGDRCFVPRGEADRPFTPDELRDFARSERVFLGNHTRDHAVLPNYSRDEMLGQIRGCQEDLLEMAGVTPSLIAYPAGFYSDEVILAAREAGLALGLTVHFRKNFLPIDLSTDEPLELGRFILSGDSGIAGQCEMYRPDVSIYALIKGATTRSFRS